MDYFIKHEQEVKEFVEREVIYNVSLLVAELAKCENSEYYYYVDVLDLLFQTDPETDEEIEVFEHWIVSDFLAHKLEEHGETVCYDLAGLTVWARTTTGQHIALDGVICDIHKEIHENT